MKIKNREEINKRKTEKQNNMNKRKKTKGE